MIQLRGVLNRSFIAFFSTLARFWAGVYNFKPILHGFNVMEPQILRDHYFFLTKKKITCHGFPNSFKASDRAASALSHVSTSPKYFSGL